MKDNILGICLGNNVGNLYGSKNDAILFYNYLYSLHKRSDLLENWLKPSILYDSNVAEDNIKNIIKNCNTKIDKILIFYSGHGYSNMKMNIYGHNSNKINDRELINLINSVIENEIELYIILDCCYSGKFNISPYNKIKKIHLISSCSSNQLSSESLASFEELKEKLENERGNLNFTKNNIIIGVFTYNLVDILYKENLNEIGKFKDVFDENKSNGIWSTIRIISKQIPKIIWL